MTRASQPELNGATNGVVENPLRGPGTDLIVGIPTYNEADSIGFVARQAAEGLRRHFPNLRTALVNADNSSTDGTRDVFLGVPAIDHVHRTYLSTPPGVKGKGNNFHNLFTYLRPFSPKAVVVVDADLKSITPEWIRLLAKPVLEGYDFVAPLYNRNEYDGTLTNHICYPLTYALLGTSIRQPIGGEFAFSSRMMEHWLGLDWGAAVRQYGVDIFMTTHALVGGFRLAQAALGSKVHKPSAPKLGPMFSQVIDTLFSLLAGNREKWTLSGRPSVPPVFRSGCQGEPQALAVDYKQIKQQALQEFGSKVEIAKSVLGRDLAGGVLLQFERGRFSFGARTWAGIVYSFFESYLSSDDQRRAEIVEALKPLYFARVASFIKSTLELDHEQSEGRLLRQAEVFRRMRKRLDPSAALRRVA